jgi:hypothetical protein
MAKLIVTMPTPVDPLIGKTNRPCDCRAPIVIINNAAAAIVTTSQECGLVLSLMLIAPSETLLARMIYKPTH